MSDHIPDEFDDDYFASSAVPPLTTVAQPSVEVGKRMAAVLMCASRVHVGAHHRSDVLAGSVVGAIGGSVGARI